MPVKTVPSPRWSASIESTIDVAIDTTGQSHHRYERKSLLVPSNQPFSEWEIVFSISAMSVAAVDRLVDHSTIVQISGENYRRKRARRGGWCGRRSGRNPPRSRACLRDSRRHGLRVLGLGAAAASDPVADLPAASLIVVHHRSRSAS